MPNFIKVAELTPNSLNVDLIVKVLGCDARLHCLSGLQCTCATVGDETGTVLLRLPTQQARLEPGSTLVLRQVRSELFHGQLRLELGRWSRLTLMEDAAWLRPKVQHDVSAMEFVVGSLAGQRVERRAMPCSCSAMLLHSACCMANRGVYVYSHQIYDD